MTRTVSVMETDLLPIHDYIAKYKIDNLRNGGGNWVNSQDGTKWLEPMKSGACLILSLANTRVLSLGVQLMK